LEERKIGETEVPIASKKSSIKRKGGETKCTPTRKDLGEKLRLTKKGEVSIKDESRKKKEEIVMSGVGCVGNAIESSSMEILTNWGGKADRLLQGKGPKRLRKAKRQGKRRGGGLKSRRGKGARWRVLDLRVMGNQSWGGRKQMSCGRRKEEDEVARRGIGREHGHREKRIKCVRDVTPILREIKCDDRKLKRQAKSMGYDRRGLRKKGE